MSFRMWGAVLLVILGWSPAGVMAQGTRADYERANGLFERSRDKVTHVGVEPHWIGDGPDFWYATSLGSGQYDYQLVEGADGTRQPLFHTERLGKALSQLVGKEVDPNKLGPDSYTVSSDGLSLRVRWEGKHYACPIGDEAALKDDPEAPPRANRRGRQRRDRRPDKGTGGSPRGRASYDGAWKVEVTGRKLTFRATTSDETHTVEVEGPADSFVEPDLVWSHDGRFAVALRTTPGQEHKVHAVESSPRDQLQPRLHTWDYLKPGDRIPQTFPVVVDLEQWTATPVPSATFANPWSIDDVRWSPDSSRFTFVYNQRGHQVLRVIAVDPATAQPTVLVDETPETFFDYAYKRYLWWNEGGDQFLWMSERSGWNHLYRMDGQTGKVLNPVTQGEWVVRGVERIEETQGRIWLRVSGVRPGEDPYHLHLAVVGLDGSEFRLLTEGDGTHEVTFSPEGSVFVDVWSRVDQPPVTELRDALTGRKLATLEAGDWSALLATGWRVPERFVAKGRDRQTDIYGVVYRPTNHSPARKYPVIEQIYAGPHGAFVPKRFSWHHPPQTLAELGFIVVQIDGMGTNHRSKAFHDVAWKNLGDSGFPDRILWIRALAEADKTIDLSRGVGIYGGSAGGQSALRALLAHGDFYYAAVADCGCHDNRMDKIWWNELWMSYPVGPHYEEQSNVTQAHRLTGQLLLMVGELDRNVDPASTLQVVNALIRADKDFELLVFPGGGHGSGSPYAERRRRDFFVRHLLQREPRSEPAVP